MPSFLSAGKPIHIEHHGPEKPGTHPAVMLLHGSSGPLNGIGAYAGQAANFGIHVFIVHYFDRTGHQQATPADMDANFIPWYETIGDAIGFIEQQPGVDPSRIALMGFSLGSYLALSLAVHDRRIAAVAEFFGGLPKELHAKAETLPPLLIIHGADDAVVPVSEAYALERLCQQHNIPYAIKIYEGQGHTLKGFSQMDALSQVISFFKKTLAQPGVER